MKVLSVFAFFISTMGWAATTIQPVTVDIVDTKGEQVGTVQLTDTSAGLKVVLQAGKLIPGKHGFHIHSRAKCEGPDFKSAGDHFNPLKKKHGAHNPQGHHAGDLPNIAVNPDGTVKAEAIAAGVTLYKGTQSLLKNDGASFVIHAVADDEMSDPAGNAGARIACGALSEEKLKAK